MRRDIQADLLRWQQSSRRKPLVLNGARQVGKTTALKAFGAAAYRNRVYLNFEKDADLRGYFELSLDPKEILKSLSLHTNVDITPHETLIILDEIQSCPRALNSLKYFCEEAPEYHVAAAGSLLGVKAMHTEGFPVGKVNFLDMYPMSFFEFLLALGEEKVRKYLQEYREFDPLPDPLHEKLIKLLKYYFYVGGMPEAVATYQANESFSEVREVHEEILSAYERDFSKHAPKAQVMNIITIWDQASQQLAKENKKFIFSAIRQSARGREYESAIQWLVEAGLIYKCHQVSTPRLPLDAYANHSAFKIYMLDVGLLSAKSQLSAKTLIDGDAMFTEHKGALTENFVAQEMVRHQGGKALYYWSSQGTAEVDFLLQHDQSVYPLEVKAGNVNKKKSLMVYEEKFHPPVLSRSTTMNLKHDGRVANYPLYLISRFPELFTFLK